MSTSARSNAVSYTSTFDVAVVGRAAVGLAAALALARTGLRVALVGPVMPVAGAMPAGRAAMPAGSAGQAGRDADDWDNRVFALSPASRRLLESLGAWQAMAAERIAPVYDMKVWPSARLPLRERDALHFSAWQARIEALAWIVENRNLNSALNQACRFAGFASFDAALAGMDLIEDRDFAVLTLADGRSLRARLVVGADGAASTVRELAGIGQVLTDYPQRAVVANFATGKPHRDCAWQWFGEHGILALLPLPGERCSIVWSAPLALAGELLALDAQALAERVSAVSDGVLGELTPIGKAAAWPLRLGRVDALAARRVVLVGDAAHVVHPLAGQGMNLGFGDVQALAEVMREREAPRDPGEAMLLRRYERARAEPVLAMRWATDGLQKLFDPGSPIMGGALGVPLAAVRDLGFGLVARSGLLRRLLISHAVR
ncbi:MAG: FAD-dependent monooxygenase [Burkholderiaceae bacterium]